MEYRGIPLAPPMPMARGPCLGPYPGTRHMMAQPGRHDDTARPEAGTARHSTPGRRAAGPGLHGPMAIYSWRVTCSDANQTWPEPFLGTTGMFPKKEETVWLRRKQQHPNICSDAGAREIAPHTPLKSRTERNRTERHHKPDETVVNIDQQRIICWNPEQNTVRLWGNKNQRTEQIKLP